MRDHLSISQINLYLTCPLKYRFTYIDELPKPFKPSGLALGSAIHSSIAWLHKWRLSGIQPSFKDLAKIFQADWSALKLDNILFKDGKKEKDLMDKGKEMLEFYYFNFPLNHIKAVELPFRVPLANLETGEVLDLPLDGIIDLIEEKDTVVELKTSSRTIDPLSLSQNLQLTAYGYAYFVIYRKNPKLRIDSLIKSKKVRMEQLQVRRDKEDYIRLFHVAKEVLKGIRSGYFCPNYSWMCNDCQYYETCQKWEG